MARHPDAQRELAAWLDRHGYHHEHSRPRHHQARKVTFPAVERDHHITTCGRRALSRAKFALPPGPEERRRGIKGRLPIDTIRRARSALARASMMHNEGTISAKQLAEVRRAVHRVWPSIEIEAI